MASLADALGSLLAPVLPALRKATLKVSIEGTDVSADLSPYLLSLSYTDKDDAELDDLQLTLEDRDRLWQGDWLPSTGTQIEVTIYTENFNVAGGKEKLECGTFEIDEVTLDSSRDAGDTVTIKAVPACAKSSLFREKKTRAWSDAPLYTVGADVVGPAGLDLLYKAPEIVYQRVEQREESDLEFLQRIVTEQGLRLALKSTQAVIYSGATADALDPVEISRTDDTYCVSSVSFKHTIDGVYNSAVVSDFDPGTSEEHNGDYVPEEQPGTGKVLRINKKTESPAQAERIAIAELREANCKEYTATMESIGQPSFRAGTVLELKGWGKFDRKYVVEQATHTVSRDGGYRTSCDLVLALDY